MVKVMYNDRLIYKLVIWAILGISLSKESFNSQMHFEIEHSFSIHPADTNSF